MHLAVGNSHIDTAWLWPLRETHRKVVRTFSTASTFLDRDPAYRFAASQPQQLAWVRDEHPDLWARIQDHVAAGRFDVVGAMWVEPDCNVPSGESLARQLVHGKRFWREAFGVESDGLWLPDVFGYSAALPQILAQAGVDWFLTQKLSWNDTNRFPHQTFWWEGIDGTRVFTHFPPADTYNGDLSVANLLHAERTYAQRDVLDRSVYLYGHGDGGGGPDVDMLERLRLLADLDGLGRVEPTGALDAIAALRAEAAEVDLPVWVGELYLELHRGTYTTHGAVKEGNRDLERALFDTELWSLAAHRHAGLPVPADELDEAWKTLLLHQFHDIIPGSSIHWVYDDTHADHERLRQLTDRLCTTALDALAARVDAGGAARPALVANGLAFARDELVEHDGRLVRLTAPACGWEVVDLDRSTEALGPAVQAGPDAAQAGSTTGSCASSGTTTACCARCATTRPDGRPWPPARRGTCSSSWTTTRGSGTPGTSTGRRWTPRSISPTPTRWPSRSAPTTAARCAWCGRSGRRASSSGCAWPGGAAGSRCTAPSTGTRTTVSSRWPSRSTCTPRSPATRSSTATWSVPPTATPPGTQARFETCAHTWVDLSEDGFGVAVLNDAKYGHDVLGATVRISLLRAPTWPDPVADRGRHTFAYALHPHAGGPTAGGVIEEAHAFNAPLRVRPVGASDGSLPARHSVVEPDGPGVVIAAVKAADDGSDDTVVRLHEAFGGRRRARLRVDGATRAERVDLLEEPLDGVPVAVDDGVVELDLRAFELVTLRLG